MNFHNLQQYYQHFKIEKVNIIGKDFDLDGFPIHMVSVIQRKDGCYMYMLQPRTIQSETGELEEQINRERILQSLNEMDEKKVNAIRLKKLKIQEQEIEFRGASCGNAIQGEAMQTSFFFLQMMQNGWSIPETSYFYRLDWEMIDIVILECEDKKEYFENFPKEINKMELTMNSFCCEIPFQIPIQLEIDNTYEIELKNKDDKIGICYINKVEMLDVLEELKQQFADSSYQEKILKHVTEEQFQEIQQQMLRALEQECPKGMGYFAIEYECTIEDINLQFYAKKYLEDVPKPKMGSASTIMWKTKTKKEKGLHGLKCKSTLISYAVPIDTKCLEAELLLGIKNLPEKKYDFF